MNKPHKHAAVIKAWADGAEIEVLNSRGWELCACPPSWYEYKEYRVKPEPLRWSRDSATPWAVVWYSLLTHGRGPDAPLRSRLTRTPRKSWQLNSLRSNHE